MPKGWQPDPKAVIERDRIKSAPLQPTSGSQVQQPAVAGQKGKHNMLSAEARGTLLGEPVAPKSVFDYMSAKNRERLAGLAQARQAGESGQAGENGQADADAEDKRRVLAPAQPEAKLEIPSIEPRIAQAALKGFMPYGDDLAKRARYKAFLEHAAVPVGSSYAPQPLPGRKMGDLNKELADFASAAAIFKPMSGMMANRFTSGSTASALLAVEAQHAGLQRPTGKAFTNAAEAAAFQEEEADRKKKEQEERDAADPRRAAARAGMFGPLTRSIEPFYPARLVCKRFNVPDPHPEGPKPAEQASFGQQSASSSASQSATSEVLGQSAIDEIMKSRESVSATNGSAASSTPPAAQHGHAQGGNAAAMPTLANVGLGDDESQGRDTLTYQKPSMDIFKAIFADSEDEDEDEEEDSSEPVQQAPLRSLSSSAGDGKATMEIDDPSALPDASLLASRRAKQEQEALQVPPAAMTMDSIGSFKPTFVSKSERAANGADSDGKKEKNKKKKQKASSAIVSFDMDDGDGNEENGPKLHKKAKKRKSEDTAGRDKAKKEKKTDAAAATAAIDDEDEWVEKPVAASQLPAATATAAAAAAAAVSTVPGSRNVRMRASELF